MVKKLKVGNKAIATGKVKPGRTARMVTEASLQPMDKEDEQESLGILPVYSLAGSLTQNDLRRAVALEKCKVKSEDEAFSNTEKSEIYYKFMNNMPIKDRTTDICKINTKERYFNRNRLIFNSFISLLPFDIFDALF